jgi:hypothetical protein
MGDVARQNSETDRDQEQRLIVFCDGEPNEDHSDREHDDVAPRHVAHCARAHEAEQHVHSDPLFELDQHLAFAYGIANADMDGGDGARDGAAIDVFIFIASITSRISSGWTAAPGLQRTSTTEPAIGQVTPLPDAPPFGLGAAAAAGPAGLGAACGAAAAAAGGADTGPAAAARLEGSTNPSPASSTSTSTS